MKSSAKARLEVWGATLITVGACIVMRFSSPGVPRTVLFVTSVLVALWLILVSIGHTRRSDD